MPSVKVRIQTAAGPLAIVGTEQGVTEIYFEGIASAKGRRAVRSEERGNGTTEASQKDGPSYIPPSVRSAVRQLEQYFTGERTTFDFPMHYTGTEFQLQVWTTLLTIPVGETRTYGQIAQSVGKPKAARAVGGAVGSNPISIAIPCHRVVAADGSGGGYGGGMEAKRFLLHIEGVALGEVRTS